MWDIRKDRHAPVAPGFLAARSMEIARLDRLAKEAASVPFISGASFDEAAREAVAALHELEGRVVRTRAKTPMGMLVKARMAAVDPAIVSTVDDLEHALEEGLDTGYIIGLSLILDVLSQYGGDA